LTEKAVGVDSCTAGIDCRLLEKEEGVVDRLIVDNVDGQKS
jgi:hypothetical protein